MSKLIEKAIARQMRAEHGTPVKQLARLLDVSQGTASVWVRDIVLTEEQRRKNAARAGLIRRTAWSEICRDRRRAFQAEGRKKARRRDPLHLGGCMLYWAEGAKARNTLILANSDVNMLIFYRRFLVESLLVPVERITIRLNVYLGNAKTIQEIERYWLDSLALPESCLRKHSLNHFPTSSSGLKKNRLPHGVCTVKVLKSTPLVQHVFGAIQEYSGLDEPSWLDGHY